jgi:hypothetical protein
LLFLRDTIIADDSCSNLNNISAEIQVDDSDDPEYSPIQIDNMSSPSTIMSSTSTASSATSIRKKKRFSKEAKSELFEAAAKILTAPEEKDDEEMAFCRSLAASSRRLEIQIQLCLLFRKSISSQTLQRSLLMEERLVVAFYCVYETVSLTSLLQLNL